MSDASLSPSDSSTSWCSSPSEASSPRLIVLSEDLPLPTAPRPFSTKKSHARKQPLGHIPRPRNAFILFRCDYSRQKERTTRDLDQNDVSRMVGNIWRNMTEEQRAPWTVLAEAEKKKHSALYPGYKYTPRNKKSKPTEKSVEKQIAREAEKVVEAEVKRIAEENSKDMVTVYYPPWATRRTLTYFARRATSCPPTGSIGLEPYSETLDRAMVTTNAKVSAKLEGEKEEHPDKEDQPPSTTAEDVFVPTAYGIHGEEASCSSDVPPSWSVAGDSSLSQSYHRIDPPSGTSSWAEELHPPSEYSHSPSTHYAPHGQPERLCIPPVFYTQQGEFATSQYPYSALPPSGFREHHYEKFSVIPPLPALSPSDTSPSSSPVTPTDHFTIPHPRTTEIVEYRSASFSEKVVPQESFREAHGYQKQGFLSEFGTVFHAPSTGYEDDTTYDAGRNIFPRESSIRTTYAIGGGQVYTQQQ